MFLIILEDNNNPYRNNNPIIKMTEKSADECFADYLKHITDERSKKRTIKSFKTQKKNIKERQEERKMRMTFPLTIGKIGHKNQCWNCLKMYLYLGTPCNKNYWTTDDYNVYMREMWCHKCSARDGFIGGVNNEEPMHELRPSVDEQGRRYVYVGDVLEERKCDCGCWNVVTSATDDDDADDADANIKERVMYKGSAYSLEFYEY